MSIFMRNRPHDCQRWQVARSAKRAQSQRQMGLSSSQKHNTRRLRDICGIRMLPLWSGLCAVSLFLTKARLGTRIRQMMDPSRSDSESQSDPYSDEMDQRLKRETTHWRDKDGVLHECLSPEAIAKLDHALEAPVDPNDPKVLRLSQLLNDNPIELRFVDDR